MLSSICRHVLNERNLMMVSLQYKRRREDAMRSELNCLFNPCQQSLQSPLEYSQITQLPTSWKIECHCCVDCFLNNPNGSQTRLLVTVCRVVCKHFKMRTAFQIAVRPCRMSRYPHLYLQHTHTSVDFDSLLFFRWVVHVWYTYLCQPPLKRPNMTVRSTHIIFPLNLHLEIKYE